MSMSNHLSKQRVLEIFEVLCNFPAVKFESCWSPRTINEFVFCEKSFRLINNQNVERKKILRNDEIEFFSSFHEFFNVDAAARICFQMANTSVLHTSYHNMGSHYEHRLLILTCD